VIELLFSVLRTLVLLLALLLMVLFSRLLVLSPLLLLMLLATKDMRVRYWHFTRSSIDLIVVLVRHLVKAFETEFLSTR
jgi:hypothetical protein